MIFISIERPIICCNIDFFQLLASSFSDTTRSKCVERNTFVKCSTRTENDDVDPDDPNGVFLAKDCGKHEAFLCFLLEQGCSVCDSNIIVTETHEEAPGSEYVPELEQKVHGAAIPYASYKMVSRLIAEGAKVHAEQSWQGFHSFDGIRRIKDGEKVTALHMASFFWNIEEIYGLLENNDHSPTNDNIRSFSYLYGKS